MEGLVVVCADDDSFVRTILKLGLEERGAIVHTFSDGGPAVDFIKRNEVDVVILDLHMNIMNGDIAALNIRKLHREITIIALSAHNNFMNLFDMSMFDDVLEKPIDYERLIMNIKQKKDYLSSWDSVVEKMPQKDDLSSWDSVVEKHE